MVKSKLLNWMLIISIVGFLFSGTLTYGTLILKRCILKDPCPQYLGLSSCVYGFLIFTAILIMTIMAMTKKESIKKLMDGVFYVSILGILFSAFSVSYQLFSMCPAQGGCTFTLLLPTCFYGLIMYTGTFLLAKSLRKK